VKKKVASALGIGIGLVAIAAAILLGLGMRPGAGTITASIEIGRSPDQVWPWLHDPDKLKTWVSWLLEVRQQTETRQIWIMEDRDNSNARIEIFCDFTTIEKPRRMVIDLNSLDAFEGETVFTLTPQGANRTKLEQSGTYRYHHWFAKLMSPVIAYSAQRKLAGDLAQLKAALETPR
jgi:uncharacterized protein YndB with AHSA1/START domain